MSDSKWQQDWDSSSNEDCSEDTINVENVESEETEQSDEEDDTRHLGLDAKVKLLQESFKSIPPLMIRRVLQREDIQGALHAASSCLKAMSSSEGGSTLGLRGSKGEASGTNKVKKQKPPVLPKETFYEGRYGNTNQSNSVEVATVQVNRSESGEHEDSVELGKDEFSVEDMELDDQEYLSLDEKVKILQERFKGFPPFVIRKVLGRLDVKEDLQKASECLKDNLSPLKGTFKDRDREDVSKGEKNPGRRQAWEAQGYQGNCSPKPDEEASQNNERGAEVNAGNNTQKNKRNNKRRNRKKNSQAQRQGGNERCQDYVERTVPGANFHPGGYHGGYPQQWAPWEFPQQPQWGPYQQHPMGQGGGGPRGRGRYYRGGNQRGFPRGGGRDYQREYAGNFHYNDGNFGPHHWDGNPYHEQGYPPPGAFPRSYSEADIRTDGPQQRVNRGQPRGQPRPRNNQRGNENLNAQNRRDDGGRNWVGRGAGRGAGQRTAATPQNVPSQDEVEHFEPNVILVRGLKISTTFDTIRNFVEARSGEIVNDIAKLNEGLNALVTLEKISGEYLVIFCFFDLSLPGLEGRGVNKL